MIVKLLMWACLLPNTTVIKYDAGVSEPSVYMNIVCTLFGSGLNM